MTDFTSFEAFLIGALQGVTEFLPISSSAHLILYSYFKGEGSLPLFYNVALHFGTALALLVYFAKDWLRLLFSLTKKSPQKKDKENRKLFFNLVIASLPAGLLGLSFKNFIEKNFHAPSSLILPLGLFGILLWFVDKKNKQTKKLHQMSLKEAFFVGVGQSLALIPGVSRSASSIIACRFILLSRKDAIRFSFLMGTPIMLAAALLHLGDFSRNYYLPQFYIGFLSSFFIGLLSIHFFLTFFVRFGFLAFALYRVALALVLFFLLSPV